MQEQELATIKRPNEIDHCSREEFERRIKEIAKCKRDIIHFAENYFRVINLDKGLHVIKLYDVQKEFLQFLVDNNKVICVSGRQQGKCVLGDTKIQIRHKLTHEIKTITIEELFKCIAQKYNIKIIN